ncbi:MCE family protein [Nocardia sp. 2]|uniref:MCE family protein n=1 Tax=Nocardia acididurans TaxID=2802282 RepID=A0ABS1LXU3_9NOCA|nr:MlaD family protein [Nocardia acididurans]MBL1073192.1 MCE family protein [Nocardia acididurans]
MNWFKNHKNLVSNTALVLILLVGASYLAVSVMRFNPLRETYTVTVNLDRSGGLQSGNDVTLRGFRIGKVTDIELVDSGSALAATVEIDTKYRVPSDTLVSVGALSGAGEQYLDFRPQTDQGPFLGDGAVIAFDKDKVKTPTPVWAVLDNSSDLIAQIDPDKFSVILNELDIALSGGQDQLRALIDGISLATTGLDNLLPQTTNLLANLRTINATTSLAQPDLATLTRNSSVLFQQFNDANAELQRILEQAPGQMATLGAVLDRTADPMTSLASNFAAITKAAQLRTPALRALFPSLVVGTSAMGVPAHDNEFFTVVDIWPRPYCDYVTAKVRNEAATEPTFPKWGSFCTNPPADQQIRGSGNAPRPDVPNNGALPPAGADPDERTLPPVK